MLGVVGSLPWSAVTTSRSSSRSCGSEPGQPGVEAFEVGGVAGDVVAVAVLRVEVDEVREDQAAIDDVHLPLDLVHPVVVARGVDRRA